MADPSLYLIPLLVILIGFAVLLVVKISRSERGAEGRRGEEVLHGDETSSRFILYFKQYSESDINDLYNTLTPEKEVVTKKTETLLGEGKLGAKLLPVEVGSSLTQTIEQQIKAPTPHFKYEYIIKKLRQDKELIIINAEGPEGIDLSRLDSLIEELKEFNIKVPPNEVEAARASIKNRKTVARLLKEHNPRRGDRKLNCLLQNFPFTVKEDGGGYELISERDVLHETTVSAKLSNDTLTPKGREYFQRWIGEMRDLSIFGEAEISVSKDGEFISITSFVVY
ncbi:MAG TPA: hypothetical protein VF297_03325 [Pyrinomonadaceae bacterium]